MKYLSNPKFGFLAVILLFTQFILPRAILAAVTPPKLEREFRGLWIASVSNAQWPSKKGLPVEQQKNEFIKILEMAEKLKLNAIVFQVRPMCDALYDSPIEPWSEYLTGEMGKAPQPFYDPLTFAVAEAHKRGMELHAWINPYRVRSVKDKSPAAPNHVSKKHPELVRHYGSYLWLDPGEKAVQDYSLSVITDIVKRYDLDGIHMDDYFYPYKEKGPDGKTLDFDDAKSWQVYQASGGKLERNDWRRENVNVFIERTYKSIKAQKPWVKFGVSPFGIWKSGVPPSIAGLNAYEELYADSKKWLVNGWVDYFAPQLYWAIDAPQQSFPVLLKWWAAQNVKKRPLMPGLSLSNVGEKWEPDEIINQIKTTRSQPGAAGEILWNLHKLFGTKNNLAELLAKTVYAKPALLPAYPWLSSTMPATPKLSTWSDTNGLK
ncbi:MAG: glycoside hydrolase family 10 protein, partial [Limisphaerales bacterium]